MDNSNYTLPISFLNNLIKTILAKLINQLAAFRNKDLPLTLFYENHKDLYKKPDDMRKPKYKRKRILLVTSTPLNRDLIDKAVEKINEKYKTKGEILSSSQIEILCLKVKEFNLETIEGHSNYSDIILFTKEKKGNSKPVIELNNLIKQNLFFYPNRIEDTHRISGVENIQEDLENTLYVASCKLNQDRYIKPRQTYAIIDKLYNLVSEQVYTANRKQEMMRIYNSYGIISKPDSLPFFADEAKILVLGDSEISVDDMKKEIIEEGLNIDRFELDLEFKSADRDLDKIKDNPNYIFVCIGPLPHKMKGIEDSTSAITKIRSEPNRYPRLLEIRSNSGDLKITKSSFKNTLDEIKKSGLMD